MTVCPRPVYLEVDGQQVPITNPDKVVFPEIGVTKMDLMRYYIDVADGALRGVSGPADDPQAVRQGHHRGSRLPEAGARRSGRTSSTSPS